MRNKLGIIQVIGDMEFDENGTINDFSTTEIGKQFITAIKSNKPIYFDIIVISGSSYKVRGFGTLINEHLISFGGVKGSDAGTEILLDYDSLGDTLDVYIEEI